MPALLIDTETSDLLRDDLPLDDPSQPWIVVVAAELVTDDGAALDFISLRIKADGRSIRSGATQVHGISTRQASRSGVSEIAALAILCDLAAQADSMVGYGVGFDRKVVESALLRRKKDPRMWVRPGIQVVDLIPACAAICKIPSEHPSGGYKWPSLDQAAQAILGLNPRQGIHTAHEDLVRAKLIWMQLRYSGALEAA